MEINMFIDGKWVEALSGARRNIINPATGEVITTSAHGSADDAKIAIKAARNAFDSEYGRIYRLMKELTIYIRLQTVLKRRQLKLPVWKLQITVR